ncbi:HAD-IIB family hydrolase [Anaerostipes sp.]|uniref:HAD-IIB family hydrolase n=1 Tax=Anaerostipes sp. TaxID=1872530 RepID=UPI002579B9C5|nr:HAD-IIB family hydrolase [Anaerostipes sp.]
MGKYRGVVLFDYDFTTVDKDEGVPAASPKTIESLERLKENGYLTMLCSGRTKRFLEEDIDKFQGAITCNGAYTEIEGHPVRDIHIPENVVQKVIHEYDTEESALHLETQDVTYYIEHGQDFYKGFRMFLDLPEHWFAPWSQHKEGEHITKIVLNCTKKEIMDRFREEFEGKLQCIPPFEDKLIMDVMSVGITKGEAIKYLLEKFEINRKDSYAFGDSDNDVEMLRAVGTGVVMGKHSKAAGEAATMFTGTVKEEGITTGLERLGLI